MICLSTPLFKPFSVSFVDYGLLIILSVLDLTGHAVVFTAYKYSLPGKLAPYQYLKTIFSLFIDMFIFKKVLNTLKWIGISDILMGFAVKIGYEVLINK